MRTLNMANKHWSVETNSTYEPFDTKREAQQEYNKLKAVGVPVTLYRVEYGYCTEVAKYVG